MLLPRNGTLRPSRKSQQLLQPSRRLRHKHIPNAIQRFPHPAKIRLDVPPSKKPNQTKTRPKRLRKLHNADNLGQTDQHRVLNNPRRQHRRLHDHPLSLKIRAQRQRAGLPALARLRLRLRGLDHRHQVPVRRHRGLPRRPGREVAAGRRHQHEGRRQQLRHVHPGLLAPAVRRPAQPDPRGLRRGQLDLGEQQRQVQRARRGGHFHLGLAVRAAVEEQQHHRRGRQLGELGAGQEWRRVRRLDLDPHAGDPGKRVQNQREGRESDLAAGGAQAEHRGIRWVFGVNFKAAVGSLR